MVERRGILGLGILPIERPRILERGVEVQQRDEFPKRICEGLIKIQREIFEVALNISTETGKNFGGFIQRGEGPGLPPLSTKERLESLGGYIVNVYDAIESQGERHCAATWARR